MKNRIAGLGEILWDVFPSGKVIGGAPANFAYHVSQFGYEGYAVSAIGNDTPGSEITESLEQKKLPSLIEITDFPTGQVLITVDDKGIPNYEILKNVAWDNIPFTQKTKELAAQTGTVCFGSLAQRSAISRQTIKSFLEYMPEDSVRIFDINLRQNYYSRGIIHESLSLSNILKINEEEIQTVSGLFGLNTDNEETICRMLQETYQLDIVILTRGTAGSYIFYPDKCSFYPTPEVKVADTVGAGDSFTAAFVASYLKNGDISQAHKFAVEVSAYVCTQKGAMPELPESLRLSY